MKIRKRTSIPKILTFFFILVILYIVVGMLIPFMHMKEVDQDFADAFDPAIFYQESGGSVDRAAIVETSMEALNTRIHMISEAKKRIVLTTFDIREGKSSEDIFSAIIKAADQGVEVQILVDGLYGWLHMSKSPMFYAVGSNPNIEIRYYNQPNFLKPWTIHGRMHDKYLIIDDKLLLMGGRNTFDYFLGNYNKKKLSYDRDVLIYNTAYKGKKKDKSIIHEVDEYFKAVWNGPYCKTVLNEYSDKKKEEVKKEKQALLNHYAKMKKKKPKLFSAGTNYKAVTAPVDHISFIHNPTGILGKEPEVWYQVKELMKQAKKRVFIQTPYAAFSKDMYAGMGEISDQVEQFDMMINSVAVGDNFMASSDYLFNKKKVWATGVEVYEFQGDHSSHGKSILIDDDISIIGSYNLDMRSTYVDTETMLVIQGKEFNQLLEKKMNAQKAQSLKVNPDGTYEKKKGVTAEEVPVKKQVIFHITSVIFQLFRYLI